MPLSEWLRPGAVVGAAAVLLGIAAVSGPFYVSSTGAAMLERELDAGAGQPVLLEVGVSGSSSANAIRLAEDQLAEELEGLGLPAAELGVTVRGARLHGVDAQGQPLDDPIEVTIVGRPGGMADLPPTEQDHPGELAMTSLDASRIPGDPAVERPLRLAGPRHDVRIGPVVAAFDRSAMPAPWQPVSGLVSDPPEPPPGYLRLPALLADTGTVLDLLGPDGAGQRTDGRHVTATASFRVLLDEGAVPTLEEARGLLEQADALARMAADRNTDLGYRLGIAAHSGQFPGWPVVRVPLEPAVERTEAVLAELSPPVRALAYGGQLLALAVIAGAATMGSRHEQRRARLWASRGISPARLGIGAASRGLAPIALGSTAGWALGGVLLSRLGPSGGIEPAVRAAAVPGVAATAAAALVVLAVCAALAARASADRASPRRIPPLVEVTALILAGLGLWHLEAAPGAAEPVGPDPLALALPLLLIVGAVGLGTRVLRAVLRRSGLGRRTRSPGWYLACRRLAALPASLAVLVALTAGATGVVVMAATLAASSEATVEEKARMLVGADAVAQLPRSRWARDSLAMEPVSGTSTVAWVAAEALLDDHRTVDVLGIDPTAFAQVANQPRRLADVDLDAVLAPLAADPSGHAVPAVLVGLDVGSSAGIAIGGLEFAVAPTATVEAFPGMVQDRPLVVVNADHVVDPDDQLTASLLSEAGTLSHSLWVRGDADVARNELAARGVRPEAVRTVADVRDSPSVAATAGTLRFLQGQAVAMGLLGLLALLAAFTAQQRDRALSMALAVRMGLRHRARTTAAALELAGLIGVVALVGGAGGMVAARAVLGLYDPLPALRLPPVLTMPATTAAAALACGLAAAAVALAADARASGRVDIAHLLRRG